MVRLGNKVSKTDTSKRDAFLESLKKGKSYRTGPRSEKTKKKISESMKGKTKDTPHRHRIRESMIGKKKTKSHCINISASQRGRQNNQKQNETYFLHFHNTVTLSLEIKIQTGKYKFLDEEKEMEGVLRPHYDRVRRFLREKRKQND